MDAFASEDVRPRCAGVHRSDSAAAPLLFPGIGAWHTSEPAGLFYLTVPSPGSCLGHINVEARQFEVFVVGGP